LQFRGVQRLREEVATTARGKTSGTHA
jgi:hypothetical protein